MQVMVLISAILFFSPMIAVQLSDPSLGNLRPLPPQLMEQMPLYIADVSKDANEAVQCLITLSRVNKYCNALVKKYLTESGAEGQKETENYKALIHAVEGKWENMKPATAVKLGLKAVLCKRKKILEKKNYWSSVTWSTYSNACFEYAVHANKTAIALITPEKIEGFENCCNISTGYIKNTPLLQIAIENDNVAIVKRLLLDLHADPKAWAIIPSADGVIISDLLAFAKQKGNPAIISLLDNALNPKTGIQVCLSE